MQNHLRRKCNQSICSAAEPVSPRRTKGASRREAAVTTPSFPSRRQGAAALSAAVTTAPQQGIAPNSHGHTSPKEHASLFPATLRERGSGAEALLLEKRPLPTASSLKLAGRGGSVSRRDHSPAARNRAQLAWAYKSEGTHKPIPSHSSGEGVWGRGASLREAASPPASPPTPLFGRGPGGGASL